MLPIEAIKSSANTIDEVSRQYEHYTGKLWNRDKCVAKHCGVLRQGNENETIDETRVRLAPTPSEKADFKQWTIVSGGVNQHERYKSFRRHASVERGSHVDGKDSKSTSHSARSSQEHHNLEHCCCLPAHVGNNHRHGRIDSCTSTKRN